MGSFATLVADRLPHGGSIVGPSSRCTSCETTIRVFDAIPIVSWLLLAGRCRICRARIPRGAFVAELAGGILGAALVSLTLLR